MAIVRPKIHIDRYERQHEGYSKGAKTYVTKAIMRATYDRDEDKVGRLADGGAKQVTDKVGGGHSQNTTHYHP